MPENFPTSESSQEFTEFELALADGLRSRKPGARPGFNQWVVAQELRAEGTPDALAAVRFHQAKLLMRAGFLREAWGVCDKIQTLAKEVRRKDLFESVIPLMNELEASTEPDEPADPRESMEVNPERELELTYKEALAAAVQLRETAENPFDADPNHPESRELLEMVRAWEEKVFSGPINADEGIDNIFRAATIWLEAGYKDPAFFRSASSLLWDARGVAVNEGNAERVVEFDKRIAEFEQRTLITNPNEKLSIALEQKVNEAEDLMRQGKFLSAIGTLAGIFIFDPRFKRDKSGKAQNMTSEQQEKIEKMLADVKEQERKKSGR